VELGWHVVVKDAGAVVVAAPATTWWPEPVLTVDDRRLATAVSRSVDDLHGLRMVTTDRPDDVFVAAGSPWYLTLFGRDSLWAARMTLLLGTGLAAGTLRTLAARQGTASDPVSLEQPGKILHELRRDDFVITGGHTAAHPAADPADGVHLPARYYGTVDATPLWVCLLHDAWRWGMPADQVEPLLRNAVRALDWVVGDGDPDGDGFLEYVDSGAGLANQGWKDSGDSVRFADGRQAEPPIALCEVQGYAYEAATRGSDLLDAFGHTGTGRYRRWAATLRERFADRFWVDGPTPYPAMALDGGKNRVDSLTSNVGHLLGTGLLSPEQTRSVVARLVDPAMDSGYGLRTMALDSGAYSPLSYHCGSVWPHDTAIVVAAMARSGHGSSAAALVDGLLAAAAGFDGRVPELYGGDRRDALLRPVPYPAACRPQAWSAAAAVSVLEALLGVRADVPAGRLHLDPMRPSPVGRLRVENLAVGSDRVSVEVDADGNVLDVSGTSLQVVTP
jgi:glycogen debranching enzyme